MYLGYNLKENDKDETHIRHLEAEAETVLGELWGIEEISFKSNCKYRIKILYGIVRSTTSYGAEIRNWIEQDAIEKIQRRYIKWTLKLDKNSTPDYIVMLETRRENCQ